MRNNDYEEQLEKELKSFLDELQMDSFEGELEISPEFRMSIAESAVLDLIFRVFLPQNVGIIDYHGAQRTYNREQISGINLNTQVSEQHLSQHALYNYTNKYSNIKNEIVATHIRELLAEKYHLDTLSRSPLVDTLKELFKTFFPGKEFLGVRPMADGTVLFPVKTQDGFEHDINELSSGEKEVLYGYLRLHNASHRNSVILLDEPELHLNPRLIQGLPQFYDKHLGREFGNQIWLLTHSDTLLREAITEPDFSVFHMQYPNSVTSEGNQIKRVAENDEIEQAIMGLVGDLATYQPEKDIVIFEGGGEDEFDLKMVKDLFPEFFNTVNPISGGNKIKVTELRSLLQKVNKRAAQNRKCFSVVDRDLDKVIDDTDPFVLKWEVYHIENYLLNPQYILLALSEYHGSVVKLKKAGDVMDALHECAKSTLHGLVRTQLADEVNYQIISSISMKIDPKKKSVAQPLHTAIKNSEHRIKSLIENVLTISYLEQKEEQIRGKYEDDLNGNAWLINFRGRDILRQFVDKHGQGIPYEKFRNLVLARMRDGNYKPSGMQNLLNKIIHYQ